MKGSLGVRCDCWALGTRLRLAGMLTDRTIAQQWDTSPFSAQRGQELWERMPGAVRRATGGGFISGQ